MITLLETCRIPPPPSSAAAAAELQLPLSFFDIVWIRSQPIRRLLFYEYSCSESHFLETLVPKLKESLSLTLKHYLPLAGNLLYPLNTADHKPLLRYVSGDSVSLKIAVSGRNFDELVGNHPRDADQFYDFVPEIPPATEDSEYKIVPVFALQVTLFPGRGICIGFSNLHSLGDARSIAGFMQAWASISKSGGEDEFLTKHGESPPVFDRSVINDPLKIDSIFWEAMKKIPFTPPSFPIPTNRVRATFTLHQSDIKKLKEMVLAKKPDLGHVSSFVVTASYVWTTLLKSADAVEDEDDDHSTLEYFKFAVDVRERINPSVPTNYFGNCLGVGIAEIEHERLVDEEGLLVAAEFMSELIKNMSNNKDEALKGAENWMDGSMKHVWARAVGVSGSPRFDLCSADFGWGNARKLEVVSIDGERCSISLCKSNDSEGGLEIGSSLPKERMTAFAAIFADGLKL
ncbi:PREDICTED: malonyl-coenzyme:anthocyanin 5-O-glucoside-6'''-O-malonyltransferase-like [Erythranthe guttata]|uniref:malonyl-coenzyme:anthocyanin 5-O-glucoside-6'''-O-malonyltransferase-like n=1 Tax=Erythranthe guttata TaxID=4155 RepID=UPI00064DC18C|nr:PREDICTED: malonyl-coenzyme:anthocyanin 5-O-glucoside-6'''-O-malonyltransferase-like [Erythranthe guttata]|eukprot:XP_012852441.1 PREDICTED: malonyl-coenzyme:anthocyanin 5-O-glucoside-6'''-O-malonyltransferase-like [Erythranthe guttata]